jgi:hypothetical protein
MKKTLSFLVAHILVITLTFSGAFAATTATPTSDPVYINNTMVPFEAYTIDYLNHFKLRDLAKALSGTAKQFDVGWDSAKNAISITTGQAYTTVGGEFTNSGMTGVQSATPAPAKVYIDSKKANITAYTINSNNYFKLRDIGKELDFYVFYDWGLNCISIMTDLPYYEAPPTMITAPSPTPSQPLKENTMKVNITDNCVYFIVVNKMWWESHIIDGLSVNSGQSIKLRSNSILNLKTIIHEYGSYNDICTASSQINVTADDLKNGFTFTQAITVWDNMGSKIIAKLTVTYEFTPK